MSTTETTTSAALPAAWYRDPSGRHQRRWWDGEEWTDKVADGQAVSSDPPLRSRPEAAIAEAPVEAARVEAAPVEAVEAPEKEKLFDADGLFDQGAATDPGAEAEQVDDVEDDPEEPEEFDRPRERVPIEQRATTAPSTGHTLGIRMLAVGAVVLAVVGTSLWWGFTNKGTAEEWKDRGDELQEELVRMSSNADALEQALARSASRGARLADGQETFTEVQGAARATAEQLRACVDDVDGIIGILANGGTPTDQIDRATQSCAQASVNSDTLIRILDAIAGQ